MVVYRIYSIYWDIKPAREGLEFLLRRSYSKQQKKTNEGWTEFNNLRLLNFLTLCPLSPRSCAWGGILGGVIRGFSLPPVFLYIIPPNIPCPPAFTHLLIKWVKAGGPSLSYIRMHIWERGWWVGSEGGAQSSSRIIDTYMYIYMYIYVNNYPERALRSPLMVFPRSYYIYIYNKRGPLFSLLSFSIYLYLLDTTYIEERKKRRTGDHHVRKIGGRLSPCSLPPRQPDPFSLTIVPPQIPYNCREMERGEVGGGEETGILGGSGGALLLQPSPKPLPIPSRFHSLNE